jgi:hypothetical protein
VGVALGPIGTKDCASFARSVVLEELEHVTVATHLLRTKIYEIIVSHRDGKFGQIMAVEEVQMGYLVN